MPPTPGKFRDELRRVLRSLGYTGFDQARLLETFSSLHDEIERILTQSGYYTPSQINRLLNELDAAAFEHAVQIANQSQASQVAAWMAGKETFDAFMLKMETGWLVRTAGFENPLIQAALTTDRITAVTNEMRGWIRAEVLGGIMQERPAFDVMTRISQIIGIRDKKDFRSIGTTGVSAKAERIFRVETMTMLNTSTELQMLQAAEVFPDLKKFWLATADLRTRATHAAAHGQIVGVNEQFMVGGYPANHPLDPTLPPKERMNCRCRELPYREEWGTVEQLFSPALKEAVYDYAGA